MQTVIVSYNTGRWLQRSIGSALAFTSGPVTVVDNASVDDSVNISKKRFSDEPRLNWVCNEFNRGFAAANNQVVENKLCEDDSSLLIFLNPDCEINEETMPAIVRAFDECPKLGLASCLIHNQDGSIQNTCKRKFPTPWSSFTRLLLLHKVFPGDPKFADFNYGDSIQYSQLYGLYEKVEAISGAFMVARLDAIKEVGMLDEGYFMHCEDLDWCKRFAIAGWDVGVINSVNVIHAKGISSQSRPIRVLWTLHRGMMRFFNKFYFSQYSWPTRVIVKAGIAFSFLSRALVAFVRGVGR